MELIGETLKSLAPRITLKDLELNYDLGQETPRFVAGDPARLRQVFINLLGNAVKFTERGEIGLAVTGCDRSQRTSEQTGKICLEFTIHDTGIGIPEDQQRNIFAAFSQADGEVTRKYGGTGLGLTITKQLVEMMGGDIRVESRVGVGSRFIFRIWLKEAAEPDEVLRQEAVLKGLRVLAVDDNPTDLHVLTLMLERLHMRQESAPDGATALEMTNRALLSGDPYRFILLDVRMPGIDGFKVAETLRKDSRHADTTLMMLTANGVKGDAVRCKELGLSAYFMKPISLTQLRDALGSAITSSGVENEDPAAPRSPHETRPACRILLAEDNPVNQKLAIKLLEKQGHQVTIAENGQLAVDAWRNGRFDLILMDMMMPQMDGLEATRRIRQIEREESERAGSHTPIIAMTANAMTGDRERCIQAGMDSYVSKPVKPELLYQEIDLILHGAAKHNAPEQDAKPGGQWAEPVAPRHEELPIFDRADALSRIADDADLLATLLEMFAADAPGYLDEIDAALACQDWPRLLRAGHTLKGVFATFSARRGEQLARDLENAAKRNETDACARLAAILHEEVGAFLNAVAASG